MHSRDQHILILGAKRSGIAAAQLLRAKGFGHLRVMDSQPLDAEETARFQALGIPVVSQTAEDLAEANRFPDLVVLSPGVSPQEPVVQLARQNGAAVIGEVELASYFLLGPILGITGSNGKTTTTALTGHLLHECGIRCQVGGNIGTAVTSLVASSREDQWNVFELSSFQLETSVNLRCRIAVCLNVTPDHLDRHGNFANYAAAKGRIFRNQTSFDFAVLNYDDSLCREYAAKTAAEVHWFSASQSLPQGVAFNPNQLLFYGEPFMERTQIKLRGLHNVENVMAATLSAHLAGAPLSKLGSAVASFPGVEHRIEFAGNVAGVDYFNDSKATNVDATLKAIDAFPGNLWIILGGKDKGSDYAPLRAPLEARAKSVLLIGAPPPYPYAAAPLIRKALAGAVPLVDCGDLEHAVNYARVHALPGDVVLLAPACASFDQFENFEQRGHAFKHLVAKLFH